ncbi:MAG: hypothetical protein ACRCZ1_07435 [Cetobacterium sp.]
MKNLMKKVVKFIDDKNLDIAVEIAGYAVAGIAVVDFTIRYIIG